MATRALTIKEVVRFEFSLSLATIAERYVSPGESGSLDVRNRIVVQFTIVSIKQSPRFGLHSNSQINLPVYEAHDTCRAGGT
jgi:hypothetical protein